MTGCGAWSRIEAGVGTLVGKNYQLMSQFCQSVVIGKVVIICDIWAQFPLSTNFTPQLERFFPVVYCMSIFWGFFKISCLCCTSGHVANSHQELYIGCPLCWSLAPVGSLSGVMAVCPCEMMKMMFNKVWGSHKVTTTQLPFCNLLRQSSFDMSCCFWFRTILLESFKFQPHYITHTFIWMLE